IRSTPCWARAPTSCRSSWRWASGTAPHSRRPVSTWSNCPEGSPAMPWRRRHFRSRDIERAFNVADLREMARRRVPGFVFEYVEGGAEDEVTLRANREALESLRFVPHTLVDTEDRHQRVNLFGREC